MKQILPEIPRPLPVVIDTDPAAGFYLRDIDDVLAILFMMASPEVRVDALTVTFGNASLKKTFEVARRTRAFSNTPDIPVLSGASSWRALGRRTPAVDFIIEYFREHKGRAVLLALGPLTNVATALMIEPRLVDWIPAAVIMGGNMGTLKSFGPLAGLEFNFAVNAKAAEIVLASQLNKWLATMDLCVQARFGMRVLKKLRELNPHCAADRLCDFETWIRFNSMVFGKGGFYPWDPVAGAMLIEPDLFDDVEELPLTMANKGIFRRTLISDGKDGRTPCKIPMKLKGQEFTDLLIKRLSTI